MKILIVGAGWYGCHLALVLKKRNVDVVLIDKEAEIFTHAASKNQRRLHLGFHYPRSFKTRCQSKLGFFRFLETYPELSSEIKNNFYAIDDIYSCIDAETYKIIMENSGLIFTNFTNFKEKFSNIDQIFLTQERLIHVEDAKIFFENELNEILSLNTELKDININNYDYVINCTYGNVHDSDYKLKYESYISFLLKKKAKEEFSLTVVDGQFFSLYPYSKNLYTFTSVKHGVISTETAYSAAQYVLDNLSQETAKNIFNNAFNDAKYHYKDIGSDFEYDSYFTTVRVKPIDKSDSREVTVIKESNVITVISGKIDAIFTAEDSVLNILGV